MKLLLASILPKATALTLAVLFTIILASPTAVASGGGETPAQPFEAWRIAVPDLVPGATLIRDLAIDAVDISPGDSFAAEINRSNYVDGHGWLYQVDQWQVSVIILEATTHQAAVTFAGGQGTEHSDVAPNAFHGVRKFDAGIDLSYAGSVGRLVAYVGVFSRDLSAESRASADALAQDLFLAQLRQLPLLKDTTNSDAQAVGYRFGIIWGTASGAIILLGLLVGSTLSFLTDTGLKEWWRNRNASTLARRYQRDLTLATQSVLFIGAAATIGRWLALATIVAVATAWPGIRVWQSFTVIAIVILVWFGVETRIRNRRAGSDLARGIRAAILTTASRAAGAVIAVCGIAMLSVAIVRVIAPEEFVQEGFGNPLIALALALLGLEVLNWSRQPGRLAKRVLQPAVRKQIDSDDRPPVLLLRSFQDDNLEVHPPFALTGAVDAFSGESHVRFEEVIAWSAWERGPLRTFGQPGTRLQPLGAARDYHDDANWQEAIRQVSQEAQAQVLIVGRSPSLIWEIGEVRSRRRLASTIFVFPPVDRNEASRRVSVVCRALDLDPSILDAGPGRHALVLSFDDAGEPTIFIAKGRTADAYVIAVAGALGALPQSSSVSNPAEWARVDHAEPIDDIAAFDPTQVRPRKTLVSRLSDLATRLVSV
ncbi:hypothetical protein GCM10027059_35430 [Myceligenerans halotolerans]